MMVKLKTTLRRFKQNVLHDPRKVYVIVAAVVIILLIAYTTTMERDINPQAYKPLLDTIAKGESNGNYNAYYGNGGNMSLKLTDMTIAEVFAWQREYVANGSPSNAVGRYQIIEPTLDGLVRRLNIDSSEKFDEAMQDKLAIALLERRGAKDFIQGELTDRDFAANLSQEWAALPRVNGEQPNDSYYAGDGLNQAHIKVETILGAISSFKTAAQ